jgi:hypothetical protein
LGFHLRRGAFVPGFGGLPAEVENEGRRLVQLQRKADGCPLLTSDLRLRKNGKINKASFYRSLAFVVFIRGVYPKLIL